MGRVSFSTGRPRRRIVFDASPADTPSNFDYDCRSQEDHRSMSPENRIRILITLAIFLCTISLTLVSRAEEDAFTPQGAQADKPVEQTRKNIQVLKGLRESELYQT